jgi:hypothetical protein
MFTSPSSMVKEKRVHYSKYLASPETLEEETIIPRQKLIREKFSHAEASIHCPVNQPLFLFCWVLSYNCLVCGVHWKSNSNHSTGRSHNNMR